MLTMSAFTFCQLLCAGQDQVIIARVYEARITQRAVATLSRRVCGQSEEMTIHMLWSTQH